jgi:large subunit ribosomal protein L25
MSKALSLQVSQRAGLGRKAVKAVRKAGRIPGVLYGKAKGDAAVHSRPIEIEAKKLGALLQKSTSENVLVDEVVHAEVPVVSTGEPVGVKNGGGLLETMLRTIRVACLPRDLPDLITVDVSHLEIGHSVHVSELKLPENVKTSNPPELPVFSVFAPKEEVVEQPTAEVQQPEVIKEKKPEDGAAPAADAKGGKSDAKAAPKADAKK